MVAVFAASALCSDAASSFPWFAGLIFVFFGGETESDVACDVAFVACGIGDVDHQVIRSFGGIGGD